MKKFIRYLYEYRNGRRVQNVGFVKVEESDDSAVIQIYGKGFPAAGNQALEILLFYPEGNQTIGIPMGELQSSHQMSGYQLIYDSSDVGGWDNFRRIEGVILRQNHSQMPRLFMSTWQERPVDLANMVERRAQQEELVTEAESRLEESQMRSSQMERSGMRKVQEESPRMEPRSMEESGESQRIRGDESSNRRELYSDMPEREMQEISQESSQMESQENPQMSSQMESQSSESELYQESEESSNPVVFKIGRQDLVALPRNEWKLANNHFLMHGCRNFHHLLSFEKDGECWLGVPGIYHPKEQSAAHAFGFGQFMKPEEGDVMLSEDEHTSSGEFGYWCRTVSKVIDKSKL